MHIVLWKTCAYYTFTKVSLTKSTGIAEFCSELILHNKDWENKSVKK